MSLTYIEFEIKLQTQNNIPPKILKSSSEATVNVSQRLFKETITKGVFPDNLKLAHVTPVFKKHDRLKKTQTCQRFTDYI